MFRDRTYTPVGGRELPNPLYDDSRRRRQNDPQNPIGFEADTVDTSPALAQTDFISGSVGTDGFGGQRAGSPEHQADMNHGVCWALVAAEEQRDSLPYFSSFTVKSLSSGKVVSSRSLNWISCGTLFEWSCKPMGPS